jgi:hypothetical protein
MLNCSNVIRLCQGFLRNSDALSIPALGYAVGRGETDRTVISDYAFIIK